MPGEGDNGPDPASKINALCFSATMTAMQNTPMYTHLYTYGGLPKDIYLTISYS